MPGPICWIGRTDQVSPGFVEHLDFGIPLTLVISHIRVGEYTRSTGLKGKTEVCSPPFCHRSFPPDKR